MDLTLEQLKKLLPNNPNVVAWHKALQLFLPDYDITTPQRIAAFIAQCSHESGEFTAIRENLNYRWQTLRTVFPKYFPTDAIAQQYASRPNKQEAIANRVYANRMGNGDEASGDGFRYRGRGLIQLTGKSNYQLFAKAINMQLVAIPPYLESCDGAVHSACWFWDSRKLNRLADTGDLREMTRLINGGFNGLEDRINKYNKALKVINVPK